MNDHTTKMNDAITLTVTVPDEFHARALIGLLPLLDETPSPVTSHDLFPLAYVLTNALQQNGPTMGRLARPFALPDRFEVDNLLMGDALVWRKIAFALRTAAEGIDDYLDFLARQPEYRVGLRIPGRVRSLVVDRADEDLAANV